VESERIKEIPLTESEKEKVSNDLNRRKQTAVDATREAANQKKRAEENLENAHDELTAIRATMPIAEGNSGINFIGYESSLRMIDMEKNYLLDKIAQLPKIAGYDWGPRSAHTFNKKYLLLKCLWSSLAVARAGDTVEGSALLDHQRTQLIDALFTAIEGRFNDIKIISSDLAQDDKTTVPQMARLAQYVA
jgi:hypothetical protein